MYTLIITWIVALAVGDNVTIATVPYADMAACQAGARAYMVQRPEMPMLAKDIKEGRAAILLQCSPAASPAPAKGAPL